jgi:hypothetical protein
MPLQRRVTRLAIAVLLTTAAAAPVSVSAETVGREQDIVDLKLGQRVLVDDGSCPGGQVKQVSGSRMTSAGISRTRACVPRMGPKKK